MAKTAPPAPPAPPAPTDPTPDPESESAISKFAASFRNYGIALGVIVAAIPFLTSSVKLLPMYDAQRNVLTFFTSLLSLLGVALLFGIRRWIGARVFPPGPRYLSKKGMIRRLWFGMICPAGLITLSILALPSSPPGCTPSQCRPPRPGRQPWP